MKAIQGIVSFLSWAVIIFFGGLFIVTIITNNPVGKGYKSYVVQSGSMEPTIMTGDIIVVQPQFVYRERDVVTFKGSDNRIVTHRIIKRQKQGDDVVFFTKGDANRSEDQDTLHQNQIIGRVSFVIPKLGLLVAFSQTPAGFAVFIGIPAFLLVLSTILDLWIKKP